MKSKRTEQRILAGVSALSLICMTVCSDINPFNVRAESEIISSQSEEKNNNTDLEDDTGIKTGMCGENVFYSWNTETGEVHITGTGDMYDYANGGVLTTDNETDEYIPELNIWAVSASKVYSPFFHSSKVKSVVVDNGIKNIGKGMFQKCSELVSIDLPNSITEIKSNAFYECQNLKDVVLPENLVLIQNAVFYRCMQLTDIIIPNSVNYIGNYAFFECNNLSDIVLSGNLVKIGKYAFANDGKPDVILLPESLEEIGEGAFRNSGIVSVVIPENVKKISPSSFSHCKWLKSVTIKEGIEEISPLAFYSCENLTDVVIPDSVNSIGYYAFKECPKLSSITLPPDLKWHCDIKDISPLTLDTLETSYNVSENNYYCSALGDNDANNWYTSPVRTYLIENEDGTFTRIENIDKSTALSSEISNDVLIETFSQDNKKINSFKIENELSMFGGFYNGENNYYLIYGQGNPECSNEEVLRVVKYTKDWERVDSCSLYGMKTSSGFLPQAVSPTSRVYNTFLPFDAGSLRMTESNGMLYIHSSHLLYTDKYGVNHQSNMHTVIDEDSMTEVECSFNSNDGYVSHSFDQYIQSDDEYIYQLDLGDGSPRGIYLQRFSTDPAASDYKSNLMKIPGLSGDNNTGVSLGGFELSENNCIIAGESFNYWDENARGDSVRNVFVNIKDKDLNEIRTVWLTDYISDDSVRARNPHLIKISENKFMVMWEEETEYKENWDVNVGDITIVTAMCIIDGDGNLLSDTVRTSARLSDCKPIITSDGTIKWTVSNKLYSVNPENVIDNNLPDLYSESDYINLIVDSDIPFIYNYSKISNENLLESAVIIQKKDNKNIITRVPNDIDLLTIPESITGIDESVLNKCQEIECVHNYSDNINSELFGKLEKLNIIYNWSDISLDNFNGKKYIIDKQQTLISIPKGIEILDIDNFDIKAIDPEINNSELKEIKADSSFYFEVEDGVLFSRYRSNLLLYPAGKTDKEYTIPQFYSNSSVSISERAFYNCKSLKRIIIPEKISIEDNAFEGTDESLVLYCEENSEAQNYANTYRLNWMLNHNINCDFNEDSGILTISGSGYMKNCTFMDTPWYQYNRKISSVVIEKDILSISSTAFMQCLSLDNISLTEGLYKIYNQAFLNCGLTSITIPKSVEYIGDKAIGYYIKYDDNGNGTFVKDPTFKTIYGYSGSVAEKYAEDNNIEFVDVLEFTTTTTNSAITTTATTSESTTTSIITTLKTTTSKNTIPTPTTKSTTTIITPESTTIITEMTTSTTTTESITTTMTNTTIVTSTTIDTTTEPSAKEIPGDVNSDEKVNFKDIILIRRYIAGGWNIEINKENADVNKDNAINFKDVILIRRYIAGGWNVEFI